MAPIPSRQLLAWTLPTIAALLSYLWYKRKRIGVRSDTGEQKSEEIQSDNKESLGAALKEEKVASDIETTPNKSFSRSLSGVETTPIDIVLPPQLRASRSTPKVISDEELDLEIEKIKSMRNGNLFSNSIIETSPPTESRENPKEDSSSPIEKEPKLTPPAKNQKSKSRKQKPKMVRKEIEIVNGQLNLSSNRTSPGRQDHVDGISNKENKTELDLHRQSSERDSANHSPADVMLASPSLSIISDNHSEGSSDSGKGGSDLATPPPSRLPDIGTSDADFPGFYECVIPQLIVGKLIGRHGSFVNQIKDKTNAMILVKRHPTNDKMKICSIEGTKKEIEKALKMIRDKFPIKRYPELTLEQVHFTPVVSTLSLIPDHLYGYFVLKELHTKRQNLFLSMLTQILDLVEYPVFRKLLINTMITANIREVESIKTWLYLRLKLVEGINNDTILSCMVAPNHLFLQQPTHPSFPTLNVLNTFMNACYSEADSPLLPVPIPENTICAAYSVDVWYRAMVLSTDEETDTSYIKFLDYGGFANVENSKLRQIRGDFMLLPFQAAECVLANIKSLNEDGSWPEEAYTLVAEITNGHLIYTQVADYTEEGIPLVLCYIVAGSESVIFLNQRLVDEGFAEWVALDDSAERHQQPDAVEGAVGGIEVA